MTACGALRPASRLWLFLGGLNGLFSVAAGAYGRHGALEPAGREMFGIASNYQIAHGLGLLAVAWLASRHEGGWLTAPNVAGAAFTLGILLFSGSLYGWAPVIPHIAQQHSRADREGTSETLICLFFSRDTKSRPLRGGVSRIGRRSK
jgi:uncharacterized membrane protein YgdD (TMEM256/DUF423 family)